MVNESKNRLRSRFGKGIDRRVSDFIASIHFDKRLYKYDILGSLAHVKMLAKQDIISTKEAKGISDGLNAILQEMESGNFNYHSNLEDIHMNIENRLFEIVGEVAGKLHTARSRNDQIALDVRLFLKDEIKRIIQSIREFQTLLVNLANENIDAVMPGYTHLQRAQPILVSHYLLAYFEMLKRDKERLISCLNRVDVLPLGSGALAGVAYPVDREFIAKELGFVAISANSIDAVSDRDFIVEFEAAAALVMMHLSRFAEELVIWSSGEFDFIEIGDAYTSSSSIMPQKKNPDVAELVRGKTGRVYGNLISMLIIMKGLPLAYNRDMQEDKEGLFDTIDTVRASLDMFAGMLKTIRFNKERMLSAATEDFILATDVADYLVTKGLSFREAHNIVGRLVKSAVKSDKQLGDLKLSEYKAECKLFDKDVLQITAHSSVHARNIPGGTAPEQVKQAIKHAYQEINKK